MGKAKFPSDPAKVNTWWVIHLKAKRATNPQSKNEFINFIHLLSEEFPCGNCRNHIQEYLRENSFEPFMDIKNDSGEDIGMFKWAWLFHNAVNMRIHKPYVDWETAWEMFDTGGDVCTNCGVEDNISYDNNQKKMEIIRGYFLNKRN